MVTLRVSGANFDVDAFLRDSCLAPAAVFRRGEPRLPDRIHHSSGMNVGVSEADFADLDQQIRDALQFLATNRAEIERLINYVGVEGIQLDFPVRGKDAFVESYRFSAELLERVGSLGIELCVSRYIPAEDAT
jgi:hypothetical protein